jgi:hypothetical protein
MVQRDKAKVDVAQRAIAEAVGNKLKPFCRMFNADEPGAIPSKPPGAATAPPFKPDRILGETV